MAKVIIEIISSHGSKQDLRSFDQDVIKIGRDYSNDLILPDGCVSENHLLVKISPEGQIFIEDLQSKNGVFILGDTPGRKTKIIEDPTTCITSGESIFLGNSTLRIFLPTHPVPETKRLDRSKLPTFSLNRKSTVWLSIIAVLGLYFTDAIFKNPDIKLPVGVIFFAQLIILLLAVIWSGVWAFVGQLIRRKAKFRMHLTIICLFGIAVLPIFNICSYLGFMFTEPLVEGIGFFLLLSISLTLLFFGHLTYATMLNVRARIVASVIVPAIIGGLFFLGYHSSINTFSPRPPYYPRLKPIVRPFKIYSIDDFIKQTENVFSKAQKIKEKQK